MLCNRPDGVYLLRDSAQPGHAFSVSFRRFERTLHARIELVFAACQYRFTFDAPATGALLMQSLTDSSSLPSREPSCTALPGDVEHSFRLSANPSASPQSNLSGLAVAGSVTENPLVRQSHSVNALVAAYRDPAKCMFYEPLCMQPLFRQFVFSLQAICRAHLCSFFTDAPIPPLQRPRATEPICPDASITGPRSPFIRLDCRSHPGLIASHDRTIQALQAIEKLPLPFRLIHYLTQYSTSADGHVGPAEMTPNASALEEGSQAASTLATSQLPE
ncbi:unnamed protein product [Protopolystoma xenopodis]|uniref:SOCS box domain-containing protein n=1 Tax=Protopolystoma xenopodis TaxID=117903 RepID=A0A3S5BEP2_9PLAT|nr:unnamed protein product [Protopolystoma xenopodis]